MAVALVGRILRLRRHERDILGAAMVCVVGERREKKRVLRVNCFFDDEKLHIGHHQSAITCKAADAADPSLCTNPLSAKRQHSLFREDDD